MSGLTFGKSRLVIFAGLALLAVAIALYVLRGGSGAGKDSAGASPAAAEGAASAAQPKPALTVTLTQAGSKVLPVQLQANGSVAAWQEAVVGAEASGLRIGTLDASVGDSVKRGQVLATMVADSVESDVALARAGLAEATASAAEATANAVRARAVQGTGALSAQQIGQYLTAEVTAKARVESAKAQLDSQQLRLKHTRVLAPDSGIVSSRSATLGAVVSNGNELFRLIRQGRLEWRGEVTSSELSRVKPGDALTLTAPGGEQMRGKVRVVSPTVDSQTRNGVVFADLEAKALSGATSAFKPGVFAKGVFELGASQALTVVQTAVVVRDGFSYVYRVDADHRVTQLKVRTGRQLGDQVEILEGLKPDDRLVATGAGFLSEGDLVRVVANSIENSTPAPVKSASKAIK